MRHHTTGRGHPSHGVLVQGRGRSTVVHVSATILFYPRSSILDRTCLKKEKKEEEEKSSEINFGTGMRYKRRFGLLFPVLYIPYHEIQAALLNVRHCSSATRPTPKFLSAFRFADCSLELAAITPPRGLFAPSQPPLPSFLFPPRNEILRVYVRKREGCSSVSQG